MQRVDIHHLELALLFIAVLVTALAALARRFQTPYPIVLVIGGLVVSFLPNVPRVVLNPDIVFLVLLPPLLFAAAFHMPWRSFCRNLTKSSMMAFGLVGLSVAAVAWLAPFLLPGFDHRIGFVLGALVASTDAVAATAIVRRMRLPHRIAEVLEGESLLNDASSLLALELSVALIVRGSAPTAGEGALRLFSLVVIGVVIGLAIGWLVRWCQHRLNDAPVEIMLTLLAPYVAYLSTESARGSGVLATVVCGLYLGAKKSESLSEHALRDAAAVWSTVDFILNGIVFALIGLQLPYVLDGIRDANPGELLVNAAVLAVLLIALRLAWVYADSWTVAIFRRLLRQPAAPRRTGETFLLGWTGMRGVIALAAAMSLPEVDNAGNAFPQRDLLIFLTFSVIVFTLVAQGLSLPSLISALRVNRDST